MITEWLPTGGPHGTGALKFTTIPFHFCTDEDFEQFYEMEENLKQDTELLKKIDYFYCLDKTD